MLFRFLEEIANVDSSAVEQIIDYITKLLNTQVITIGGTTLTIGLIIASLIRFFVPKNKIITNQEKAIANLEAENIQLKEINNDLQARVITLEEKMNVVVENTPNKKVKEAKDIRITPQQVIKISNINATTSNRKVNKKIKIKVKKSSNNENVVSNFNGEVVSNG